MIIIKKLYLLIALLVLLVGCGGADEDVNNSDQNKEDGSNEVVEAEERLKQSEEELHEVQDDLNETEKDLYLKVLNTLLNEFEEGYNEFDTETGVKLYELIISTPGGIEGAKAMKDGIIDNTPKETQEAYSHFYDEVIELEELFLHLDWSD